jgi:hypothetical protein
MYTRLYQENKNVGDHVGGVGVDGMIILKQQCGFIWLGIGISGGLL